MLRFTTALQTVALTCLCASVAQAQPATTRFDQLTLIVKVGEKVTIRDATDARFTGRIANVSADSLDLDVDGQRMHFRADEVAFMSRRHEDSLWNGALGAGVPPALIAAGFASQLGTREAVAAGVLWGGMGAALGAGVDALITRREVLYDRTPSSRPRWSLIIGRGRRGFTLTKTF